MQTKPIAVIGLGSMLLISAVMIAGIVIHRSDDQVPALDITTLDGRQLALAERRGRPLLVHFWATTCGPCIAKIPELAEFYRRLQPKGVDFVAVAMPYDPPARVVALTRQRALPYPVALDPDGRITEAFGNIRFTPTTLLVSAEGRVLETLVGPVDFRALEHTLEGLL